MTPDEILRRIPWVPPGFRDHGSPEANVKALVEWAGAHPGPEADAILSVIPAEMTAGGQGGTMAHTSIKESEVR